MSAQNLQGNLTAAQNALLKAFDTELTQAHAALQNARTQTEAAAIQERLNVIVARRAEKLAQIVKQAVS